MSSPKKKEERIIIGAQKGPQLNFLQSEADIAIFGGAAGSGKTYAMLLEPLRHLQNPNFGAVIFRRNSTMVRNQGGLWQESLKLYTQLGGHPREAYLEWIFPSGMRLKFAHLEHEKTMYDYQGMQSACILFDELVHFSYEQFFYLLSRNRSSSGVAGYIRCSCNPDADSWVRTFIDWWIHPETGYPIPERSGKLRWFIRRDDSFIWADTKEELLHKYGTSTIPKSLTFIPASVHDNKILMKKDPAYLANLQALSRVDRLRLLGGNWNVRECSGSIFRREWFPVLDAIPSGWISIMRYWDRAATLPSELNRNPDWTRGLKVYRYANGSYLVADLKSTRDTPGKVEDLIKNVASHDGRNTRIMSQQDPGSAGVLEAHSFVRMLSGYDVRTSVTSKDKLTRAKPVSAQAEVGNIKVLRAPWNQEFFDELENFPSETSHDDIVDCLSGAFNELCVGNSLADIYKREIK